MRTIGNILLFLIGVAFGMLLRESSYWSWLLQLLRGGK